MPTRGDGVGDGLLQCCSVDARVLANIESVKMESEGAHLQDQRIDERARDADSVIGCERRAQNLKIVEEVLDRAIGRQRLGQLVVSARKRIWRHGQRSAGRPGSSPLAPSVRWMRALRQMTKRR